VTSKKKIELFSFSFITKEKMAATVATIDMTAVGPIQRDAARTALEYIGLRPERIQQIIQDMYSDASSDGALAPSKADGKTGGKAGGKAVSKAKRVIKPSAARDAYRSFCTTHRPQVKEAVAAEGTFEKKAAAGEVTKRLAKMWQEHKSSSASDGSAGSAGGSADSSTPASPIHAAAAETATPNESDSDDAADEMMDEWTDTKGVLGEKMKQYGIQKGKVYNTDGEQVGTQSSRGTVKKLKQ